MAEQDPGAPEGADNQTNPTLPGASSAGASSPGAATGDALNAANDAVDQLKSASAGTPPPEKSEDRAASALRAAQDAIAMAKAAEPDVTSRGQTPGAVQLPAFEAAGSAGAPAGDLDLLADVNLQVKIELGRTRMLVEDVLRLADGSVVELDKLAGDPVDVYVNERHVARGEVLVVNDNFCVRISEIISQPADE
jgi:flagellar motor switch protein FliN/FliY